MLDATQVPHVGNLRQSCLRLLSVRLLDLDVHGGEKFVAKLVPIEVGVHPADDALLLQTLDSRVRGSGRQADAFPNGLVRHGCVLLQRLQNGDVDFVELAMFFRG